MRVGLITFHMSCNYGALLQAYALRAALEKLGHAVEFIDYRRGTVDGLWRRFSKRRPWSVIAAVRRERNLAAFRAKHLPLTQAAYLSDADIQARPPLFDAYVCGSDQIWNPCSHGRLFRAYYLHFVPDGAGRRIAYGPSFGEFRTGSIHDEEIAGYLRRFHSLSAREEEGCEIIRQLTARTAEHVLDPTLLTDDYSAVSAIPNHQDDYIAAYMLTPSKEKAALIARVREHLGLPVVSLGPTHVPGCDRALQACGPEEWLGHIQNARFVCTDSFHGTTASILFRRDFVTVPHPTRNARIAGLLERLGIPERQSSHPAWGECAQFLTPVAYDTAYPRLEALRQASIDYLRKALSDQST